jgi:hypothetical protein
MGGLRYRGYKLNLGITEKRKRLKELSKELKILSKNILLIDKHDGLVGTMENLQREFEEKVEETFLIEEFLKEYS